MCCCGKPTINGQMGYKWQPNDAPGIRPVNPPEMLDHEILVYDEPGRCGELDSHSHHYRVVKNYGTLFLLVRHGGGDVRIQLSLYDENILFLLHNNARYWILNALYHAYSEGKRLGQERTAEEWRTAAAEKRIKTRKIRGSMNIKVWIEGRP